MTENRLPVIGRHAGTFAVAPYIPVALGVRLRTLGFDEPGMLVRGVVHYHIHEDPDLPLFGLSHQPVEIRHGAVLGIYRLVVRDVVSEIDLWGGVDGRQPDRINTQALQII